MPNDNQSTGSMVKDKWDKWGTGGQLTKVDEGVQDNGGTGGQLTEVHEGVQDNGELHPRINQAVII